MYIKNGIVYAGAPEKDLKISQVRIVGDHAMLIRFSTGETRLFDGTELFSIPTFAPLKDQDIFSAFRIDHGVLTWSDGSINIAPEYLYRKSYQYEVSA